ncbi:hypothetical protein BOSP111201_15655 [Bordetella sputigena]
MTAIGAPRCNGPVMFALHNEKDFMHATFAVKIGRSQTRTEGKWQPSFWNS